MEQLELNRVLELHKKWLNGDADGAQADLRWANLQGADLRGANLQGANLRLADLQGADMDYSCLPLWCGSLDVHFDERQLIQQLYHVCRNVSFSKYSSQELKDALLSEGVLAIANRFHRVNECGKIGQ